MLHAGKGSHSDQKDLEYLLLRWGEESHLGSEGETLKKGVRGRMRWCGEVWGSETVFLGPPYWGGSAGEGVG